MEVERSTCPWLDKASQSDAGKSPLTRAGGFCAVRVCCAALAVQNQLRTSGRSNPLAQLEAERDEALESLNVKELTMLVMLTFKH